MHTLSITPIPAFADNYFWLLHRDGRAVVVDPGVAEPVEQALREYRLQLSAILITHHHADHIGGLAALKSKFQVPVYGPRVESARIPGLTHLLKEGDRLSLDALKQELQIWEVPGHTLGHIAYLAGDFTLCGDTLFSAGCGRLFEGTPQQMHQSLMRLAALPESTAVFCAHEYTLSNLAFAAAVEPANAVIQNEIVRVRALRQREIPSLPSNIGQERRINPFLRTRDPAVVRAAEQRAERRLMSALDVFTVLRHWKDEFRNSGSR
ncbi:MAG: hydroxyacylglutathione hydrolase [Nevskiales bacterium]|nr:hydroxyacylglutathione hydrolase [Nevskiales bacterium]